MQYLKCLGVHPIPWVGPGRKRENMEGKREREKTSAIPGSWRLFRESMRATTSNSYIHVNRSIHTHTDPRAKYSKQNVALTLGFCKTHIILHSETSTAYQTPEREKERENYTDSHIIHTHTHTQPVGWRTHNQTSFLFSSYYTLIPKQINWVKKKSFAFSFLPSSLSLDFLTLYYMIFICTAYLLAIVRMFTY